MGRTPMCRHQQSWGAERHCRGLHNGNRVPLKGSIRATKRLSRFFSLVVWAALRFVLRGRRGTFEHKLVLGP